MSSVTDFVKPLDPNDTQPLYQQLQRAVREAIENHVLAPEDALPSERQLAEDFALEFTEASKRLHGDYGPHTTWITRYPGW